MIALVFTTTLRSDEYATEHDEALVKMEKLARDTTGFVSWQHCRPQADTSFGVIVFESQDALMAWRDDPDHVAIHNRGWETLYASTHTLVCDVIRETRFPKE